MCADSCFLYEVNGRNPKQVPAYKIQSTLGEIIKQKGQVDNAFMRHAMKVAWAECTCCNRCGMYCPHGIDTGIMFGYLRGLLYGQGFVPWELKIGAGMHRAYRAQMDVTDADFVDTFEWMVEEYEDDYPGLTVPIDKEGADIMYTVNAREVKHYPEDLAEARKAWKDSIQRAKEKRTEKELEKTEQASFKNAMAASMEVGNVLNEAAGKMSVTGTFNATAAWGLGTGSAADRTAKATEETARNTKKILDESRHNGATFS